MNHLSPSEPFLVVSCQHGAEPDLVTGFGIYEGAVNKTEQWWQFKSLLRKIRYTPDVSGRQSTIDDMEENISKSDKNSLWR